MKNKFLLCMVILLCTISSTHAQNFTKGSITTLDNSLHEGRISIDYKTQKVVLKKNLKATTYSFDKIKSIVLGNLSLDKQNIDNTNYFVSAIESGKGTLYKINEKQYLITVDNGKNAVIDLQDSNAKIPGTLAVLFEDCNTIRDLLNAEDNFNEAALQKIITTYNSCSYSAYAPTEREVKNANTHNTDQASFYIGLGGGLNSVSFFESSDTESLAAGQFTIGVIASPSFFGPIQGNLFVTLEGNVSLSGDNDFGNTDAPVSFSVNTFRALLGLEYQFNKTGKIKPFIGVSGGVTSDSFEGNVDGLAFDISGGNPIVAPRIGARFALPNKKNIGVSLTYIAEYENNLSFPAGDIIVPLIVNSEYFTLGVNYYF